MQRTSRHVSPGTLGLAILRLFDPCRRTPDRLQKWENLPIATFRLLANRDFQQNNQYALREKGGSQTWTRASAFDCSDRLTGYINSLCEIFLRQVVLCSSNFEIVLHWSLRPCIVQTSLNVDNQFKNKSCDFKTKSPKIHKSRESPSNSRCSPVSTHSSVTLNRIH